MSRPHTYVGQYTAEFERIAVCGISQRKEQLNDIRQTRESQIQIFDRHANLKYKYGNRHFWCRGYYVDTVGKNEKKIAEYIRNQLQEDVMEDQISLKEYIDPFTGDKNTKA